MSFVANLLIAISNKTIPLAFIIILASFLLSAFRGLAKIKRAKNNLTQKIIEPKVEKIKNEYPDEEEQLEHLNKLYKEYHFSVITPVVIIIIGSILSILLVSTVFYPKFFDLSQYTNSLSFFFIENIFERKLLIGLPLIIAIIKMIGKNIFIPKELFKIKSFLISFAIYAATIMILGFIFPPCYIIYMIGFVLGEFVTDIPTNSLKKEFYEKYGKDAPPKQVEKKSLKEIVKEMEDSIWYCQQKFCIAINA